MAQGVMHSCSKWLMLAAFDLNDGYVRSREMDSFAQDLWPVATVKVQVLMS